MGPDAALELALLAPNATAPPKHVYRAAFGAIDWTPTTLETLEVPLAVGCAASGGDWAAAPSTSGSEPPEMTIFMWVLHLGLNSARFGGQLGKMRV